MVDLKTILTSTAVSVVTLVTALTMGLGKHTAQTIHMSDGKDIEQQITAISEKVDRIAGVIVDAINGGTKKIRVELIDQAKEAYRTSTAKIKAEAEAAKRIAEAARKATESSPASTLFGTK